MDVSDYQLLNGYSYHGEVPDPLQLPLKEVPVHVPLPERTLPDLVIVPVHDPPEAPPEAALKLPVASTAPVIDPETVEVPAGFVLVTVPKYEPVMEPLVMAMLNPPVTVMPVPLPL